MQGKIIDGKMLAQTLRQELKNDIAEFFQKYNYQPSLSVILVGNDPSSEIYVRNKQKACEKVGIRSIVHRLKSDISQQELLDFIEKLNNDPEVDGILCQFPLPIHIDGKSIFEAIAKEKDVDGFHPHNRGLLAEGYQSSLLPCTPQGVMQLIFSVLPSADLSGKVACVIGRSNIVGRAMADMLEQSNATVIHCHSKTPNLAELCKLADIVVSATGKAGMLTEDFIKEGAIVIDVGISRDKQSGQIRGDVDFLSVINKAAYLTPVPGGVGPMTIYNLLANTLKAAVLRKQNQTKF